MGTFVPPLRHCPLSASNPSPPHVAARPLERRFHVLSTLCKPPFSPRPFLRNGFAFFGFRFPAGSVSVSPFLRSDCYYRFVFAFFSFFSSNVSFLLFNLNTSSVTFLISGVCLRAQIRFLGRGLAPSTFYVFFVSFSLCRSASYNGLFSFRLCTPSLPTLR